MNVVRIGIHPLHVRMCFIMKYEHACKTKDLVLTLWLFTASDIKTFVIPQAAFGVFSAFAGPLLTTNHSPSLFEILWRIPHVALWTWLNTLVFDLANQRLSDSVLEDRLNKPWRPLPAGRISQKQARRLLLLAIPTSLGVIHVGIGATEETVLLFCLTWMYNDLGGSDDNFLERNLIIAVAYMLYGSGALRVTCHLSGGTMNTNAMVWLIIIGCIIFTTMHVQDLKDIAGDRARDRKTAPLVFGETGTRYFLACAVLFWSVACSVYWELDHRLFAALLAFGILVAARIVLLRDTVADGRTWKLWSYWLISLYVLPWAKFTVDIYTS